MCQKIVDRSLIVTSYVDRCMSSTYEQVAGDDVTLKDT